MVSIRFLIQTIKALHQLRRKLLIEQHVINPPQATPAEQYLHP